MKMTTKYLNRIESNQISIFSIIH